MKYLIPLCASAVVLAACGKRDEPKTDANAPAATTAPTSGPPTAAAALQLAPTQGNTAGGMLSVTAEADGVRISGQLLALPPDAEFGFHIHEKGDCSAPDASSAGEHFNPANAQHGNPDSGAHHAGDMLNAKSDAEGNAQVDVKATGVTLGGGQPNDVLGKAVVLHEKPDDYSTQPSGNSGARIACGVITG
jgi:Cu-Zn family superoxide dismutase